MIVREGLRALLLAKSGYQIVAEVENGCELIEAATRLSPDLILMDLSMPKMNGIEAIKEIRGLLPQLKILVLTVHASEAYIHACVSGGANGYITKDASSAELLAAIDNVSNGKTHLCSAATEQIISSYLHGAKACSPASSWDSLTHRERQTLKLISEGNTNKQIAYYLNISPKTVEKHRANLMEKLRLHSAAALTAFAVKKGLVENMLIGIWGAFVMLMNAELLDDVSNIIEDICA
jgi:two-component system, NarL family, response regulator NreC